tara:strand:- start:348 stop:548 length:201 start_codon:yes stop_codon:yes gene_type:complete
MLKICYGVAKYADLIVGDTVTVSVKKMQGSELARSDVEEPGQDVGSSSFINMRLTTKLRRQVRLIL